MAYIPHRHPQKLLQFRGFVSSTVGLAVPVRILLSGAAVALAAAQAENFKSTLHLALTLLAVSYRRRHSVEAQTGWG